MDRIVLLIWLLGLMGCTTDDHAAREAARATATRVAQMSAPATASPDAINPNAGTLRLTINTAKGAVGTKVCVPVLAEGFDQLLSMQYSIRWNPEMLRFSSVRAFNLPYMSAANFGDHAAAQGALTSVWLDNSLEGVSRPNGSPLYELCYELTGSGGTTAEITFSESPTRFEVVNLAEQVMALKGVPGSISIQ